jgi:membrane-associated phospholipid phosphatase
MSFLSLHLFPSDWITIIYLGFTAMLAMIFHKNLARWYIYLFVHIALILGILSLGRLTEPLPAVWQFLRDWYAVATILIFYWEAAPLTQMVVRGFFDPQVIQWEEQLFKGQASVYLSDRFPSLILSEFLHFCYFSYYGIAVFLAWVLYAQGRYDAFFEAVFAEIFTFNICLVWYIFMPVTGPRYGFEKVKGRLAKGIFFKLTHFILTRASSKGTAFPSSHAAIAVIVLLTAARYDFTSFLILLPFCTGLVVGTVYGRFHYAVDAVAGSLLGVVTFLVYPIVYQWLS